MANYRVPKFSGEDDLYISVNYLTISADEIALKLSRTRQQILDRIQELSKLDLL